MGRWTPLVLMAGGLAILLGTLLGINFPMGRQTAQNPQGGNRTSSVLPANINVNSTVSGSNSRNRENARFAQNNSGATGGANNQTNVTSQTNNEQTQAQTNGGVTGGTGNTTTTEPVQPSDRGEQPIRALW